MSIQDEPHYEIAAAELAAWLEQQDGCWWTVDGDPILTGRVFMPCPSEELAADLRIINRPLLVLDQTANPQGRGEVIDHKKLDCLVARWGDGMTWPPEKKPASDDNRLFYFSWKGSDDEWLLLEDVITAENERADAASLPQDE